MLDEIERDIFDKIRKGFPINEWEAWRFTNIRLQTDDYKVRFARTEEGKFLPVSLDDTILSVIYGFYPSWI